MAKQTMTGCLCGKRAKTLPQYSKLRLTFARAGESRAFTRVRERINARVFLICYFYLMFLKDLLRKLKICEAVGNCV